MVGRGPAGSTGAAAVAPRFGLLGPLEVRTADGTPLAVPGGGKRRAVLAALLLDANRVVAMDRLAAGLWGDDPPPTAASVVQVHISHLRRLLGDHDTGATLQSRRPGYLLELAAEEVDVLRFEQAVRQGRSLLLTGEHEAAAAVLREGLDLWRGPALADLRDQPLAGFVVPALDEAREEALDLRVDADLAVGRHAAVVAELEAAVQAAPFREHRWGQLMLALYRSGRQAEALAAYQRVRHTLIEHLGIEPGSALRSLEARILAHDIELEARPPARSTTAGIVAGMPGSLAPRADEVALVGRSGELERLATTWDRVDRPTMVVITGATGSGKTRLAVEFARRTRSPQTVVLHGWADPDPTGYAPFVTALRQFLDSTVPPGLPLLGPMASDLAALLPDQPAPEAGAPPEDADTAEARRLRLFEAVAGWLRACAPGRQLLFLLDDLQWADRASFALLRHLLNHPQPIPVLVVATFRDDEPDGPSADAVLADLGHRATVERLGLAGLDGDAVVDLVEALLPAGLQAHGPVLGRRLHEVTGGNPLYVRQAARYLVDSGTLGSEPTEVLPLPIPDDVRQTIVRRFERLAPATVRTLRAAAVLGPAFEVAPLAAVLDQPVDDVLDALDAGAGANLVTEDPAAAPGAYRFHHPLVHRVIDTGTSAARRVALHHRARDVLARLGPERLEERARHALAAVPALPAATAIADAEQAADAAMVGLAFEQAASLYRSALEVLDGSAGGGDRETRCDLLIGLGRALAHEDHTRAGEVLGEATDLARSIGSADRLAEAAMGRSGRDLGRDHALIAALEEALASSDPATPSVTSVRLRCRLAIEAVETDPTDATLATARTALAHARSLADAVAVGHAAHAHHIASVAHTVAADRLADAELTIEMGRTAGDDGLVLFGLAARLFDQYELWRFEEAEATLAAYEELAFRTSWPRHMWMSRVQRAMLAQTAGDHDAATRLADEALEIGTQASFPDALGTRFTNVAGLRWHQGRYGELRPLLQQFVERYPGIQPWAYALAAAQACDGDHDAARRLVATMLVDRKPSVPRGSLWRPALAWAATAVADLGDPELAAGYYDLLAPSAGTCVVVGAGIALWGSADRFLALLAAAAGDDAAAARHQADADQLEAASGGAIFAGIDPRL